MNRVLPLVSFAAAVIACFFLAACGEGQSNGADIEDYLRVSKRYQEQGQFRAAIIEARNAIQKAPGSSPAINRLAQVYNELGAGKKAAELILEQDKLTDPELVLTLHQAYMLQGKYRSANELLEKFPSLQESHSQQYLLAFAASQAGLGDSKTAKSAYQQVLEIEQNNSTAVLGLANIEIQKKNFDAATVLLDKITENDSNITESSLLKSDIAYERGKLTSAEENLNNALFTLKDTDLPTPQRIRALRKLIEVLTQQGRSNEAYIYAKSLADANPLGHELNLKFQQAIDKYQSGDLEEAETLLLEVHKQSARSAMSGQMLGVINYLQGDIEEAETLLSEHVDPEIASTETKLLLASAQLGSNKPEEALRVLRDEANSSDAIPEVLAMYGLAALQTGESATGIEYVKAALQKNPDNPALHLALAQHYANTEQLDKAREELRVALKNTPADIDIQTALVEALLIDNALDEAEKVSTKIRKDYPQSSISYSLAGHVAIAKGDFNNAKKHFATAQKLEASNTSALYGLAKIEYQQKRWQQAEKHFKEIVAIDPQQVNAYRGILLASAANGTPQRGLEYIEGLPAELFTPRLVLAERYIELGDNKAALAQLKRAQIIKPESRYAAELSAQALLAKSQTQMAAGAFKEARETVLSALQIAPESLRLLQQLARVDIASEQISEAEKTLARLDKIAPNEPALYELRADLALAQGETSSAITSYRQAWSTGKSERSAGKLYQLLTQSEPLQARAFLQEWQRIKPYSPLLLTLMAQKKENAGDYRGAIKLYEKALEVAPDSPAMLNNLAWLYFTSGDKRALDIGERAYQLEPRSAAIADTYGWILTNSGNTKKGIEMLTLAAKLAPGVKQIEQHLQQAKAR